MLCVALWLGLRLAALLRLPLPLSSLSAGSHSTLSIQAHSLTHTAALLHGPLRSGPHSTLWYSYRCQALSESRESRSLPTERLAGGLSISPLHLSLHGCQGGRCRVSSSSHRGAASSTESRSPCVGTFLLSRGDPEVVRARRVKRRVGSTNERRFGRNTDDVTQTVRQTGFYGALAAAGIAGMGRSLCTPTRSPVWN